MKARTSMPRYEYRCPECGIQFEIEHGMREKPTVHCPQCNAIAEHVFLPAGMVLKGSGFYITDYRKQESAPADEAHEAETSADKHGKPAGAESDASQSCPAITPTSRKETAS